MNAATAGGAPGLGPAFAAPDVVTARSAHLSSGLTVGFAAQVPAGAAPVSATRRLPRT